MLQSLYQLLNFIFCHHRTSTNSRKGRERTVSAVEREHILRNRPSPLPSTRLNISQSALLPQCPEGQASSLLSLPLELRRLIYDLAVGGHILTLQQVGKKISIPPTVTAPYQGIPADHFIRPIVTREDRTFFPALPLLLTCRQIYCEAIGTLYGNNTFRLYSPLILVYLNDLCLRPQHLQAIRHLTFEWVYMTDPMHFHGDSQKPYDWSTWERFWHIIAHSMNLDSLVAQIDYLEPNPAANVEGDWVKPILEVKGIRKARVSIELMDTWCTKVSLPKLSRWLTESVTRQG